jgi:cephalosporin hydroxylase
MRDATDLAALVPERHWACPNCPTTAVTRESRPHSQMHHCAGLAGLWAPMVSAGQRCKVEAEERADYVGDELVRTDMNGRPVMAVRTTRDDGEDLAVYAPCATLGSRE